MSSNKKGSNKQFATKALVWLLVILMVAGSVVTVIASTLTYSTYAIYETDEESDDIFVDVVDTEDVEDIVADAEIDTDNETSADADDIIVRIGLLYGNSVVSAFRTRSPYGFKICSVDKETDEVTQIYSLSSKILESTIEKNLAIVGGDYIEVEGKCDIGAYHAMLDCKLELDEMYLAMNTAVKNGLETPMIASYSDGAYRLFVGSFKSSSEAQSFIDENPDIFAGLEINEEPCEDMTVYKPSETAIMLIDPETNMTVFEFDGGDTHEIGLAAKESEDDEKGYLQTPANKLYDGIFLFTRYKTGVQLVNLIELEDYIKGVLPYEISNSWPLETQKAFAICVRSYTVNKFGRHNTSYGFDLCNTVCCQAYNGVRNVNEAVEEAVEGTKNLVLTDEEEKIITTFYSAVAGGTTVSVADAWGGSYNKNLLAISTPWEDYSGHIYGKWTWSVSPSELMDILVSKGYDEIDSPIAEIKTEYAENSNYVYKITFIDENGNSKEIKTTDAVRTKLAPYLKSSNFIVGQGSVTVNDPAFDNEKAKTLFSRLNGEKISYIKWTEPMKVVTSEGEKTMWASVDTPVLTGKNKIEYVDRSITLEADKKNDFLFVGRGWGHGVGISQVGAYNLGVQGFDYKFILSAYFPTANIVEYEK